MISVFDLFKIGIGPSSSHTMGPMLAAHRFVTELGDVRPARITAELFGSLAWTGRGHATDTAIFLGLLGETPATIDPDAVPAMVAELKAQKRILQRGRAVRFDPETDLVFDLVEILPRHTNAMRFRALDAHGAILKEAILYSIGGGFVVTEEEEALVTAVEVPHPFDSAEELLKQCDTAGLGIAEVQYANERALRSEVEIEDGLDAIRDAMFACIDRGLRMDGQLPGGLKVKRRARALITALESDRGRNDRPPHDVMDWVSTYAMAVNEENASGGRVVTAPTNGAAGIVPAVLRYYRDIRPTGFEGRSRTFLLAAAAIGGLIKSRASISGAEVGCQGEVGSAASMAAAGLTAAFGGTARQIENAAEMAMEHHLGLTCDPIGGLVQIPCIERNAFGANKAIVAASLSLRGDGTHRVTLDEVIETMRQTGADMASKYKETSQGGLAVNVAEC